MKLEREKDIPAFQGKTWRERIELRSRARQRDRTIIWLQCLMGILAVPILALSHWLTHRYSSLLPFIVVYMVLACLIFTLYHSLFITPRIRRALESDAKPSA
jgi:hypothetical protein